MHAPYSWPIKDSTIEPLYLSMYAEQFDTEVVSKFLSKKSKANFEKFGKIGARDKNTFSFFSKNNIDSYVSGCVTLTIQKDPNIVKKDFILLVDVSEEVYDFVKRSTNKKVIYITNAANPFMGQTQRNELAEQHLYLYQSAYCVVTERLHAALPCLALETPVLLLKKKDPVGGNVDRFGGLGELCHYHTEEEFMASNAYDINNPPTNLGKYLEYRNQLVKTCEKFTGYNNDKTFARSDIGKKSVEEILIRMEYLKAVGLRDSATGYIRAGHKVAHQHSEIDRLHAEINHRNSEIDRLHAEINHLNSIKASARKLLSNIKRRAVNTYHRP
jgi:cell division protein FtsB